MNEHDACDRRVVKWAQKCVAYEARVNVLRAWLREIAELEAAEPRVRLRARAALAADDERVATDELIADEDEARELVRRVLAGEVEP